MKSETFEKVISDIEKKYRDFKIKEKVKFKILYYKKRFKIKFLKLKLPESDCLPVATIKVWMESAKRTEFTKQLKYEKHQSITSDKLNKRLVSMRLLEIDFEDKIDNNNNIINKIDNKTAKISANKANYELIGNNFININNCCYMSCIIQCLAYSKFKEKLINESFHINCSLSQINKFCVVCELKEVVSNLFSTKSYHRSIEPKLNQAQKFNKNH